MSRFYTIKRARKRRLAIIRRPAAAIGGKKIRLRARSLAFLPVGRRQNKVD